MEEMMNSAVFVPASAGLGLDPTLRPSQHLALLLRPEAVPLTRPSADLSP